MRSVLRTFLDRNGCAVVDEAPSYVILQRIASVLATITTAGGYFNEVGADRIDLEKDPLDPSSGFPRIALAEDTSAVTSSALSADGLAVTTPLFAVAEGYVELGDNQEQQAHRLKWDMTRALAQIRRETFAAIEGASVSKFEIVGDRPTLRRPDGINFIVVQVRATVTVTTYFPPATGN
jgi:hypothetical protein